MLKLFTSEYSLVAEYDLAKVETGVQFSLLALVVLDTNSNFLYYLTKFNPSVKEEKSQTLKFRQAGASPPPA